MYLNHCDLEVDYSSYNHYAHLVAYGIGDG